MSDWLRIDDLSFGYGLTRVFAHFSLSVPEAERVLAVTGRSGVGKSTFIGLLAGHLLPQAGRIEVCGSEVRGPSPERPVVFQDHNLFPWKTALGNVVFGPKCLGVPLRHRRELAFALLDQVGLRKVANWYPHSLSGGMRQRVGLARALAVNPTCLLLDEPFSSLDEQTEEGLVKDLLRYVSKRNVRVVIVTHKLEQTVRLGNRILVLQAPDAAMSFAVFHDADRIDPSCRQLPSFTRALAQLRELLALD
jgi:NitT/TauT family transport system ATP-binding protein